MKKKAYRATSVKDIKISEVVPRLAEGPVHVGLDIGKGHTMVVVRDSQGTHLRPWKVLQPGEIRLITAQLKELSQHRPLTAIMEPTGTYGEPLRQALCDAGLVVHQVNPKLSKDFSEVFDGTPSQHDGKDAGILAELGAIGKSRPWPMSPSPYGEMECEVLWLDMQQNILQQWLGRLEALLAGHWPELPGLLELNSPTLLKILAEYGGPAPLAADPEASKKLAGWGGLLLKREKIEAVVTSAKTTVGARMTEAERDLMRRCARAAETARKEIKQAQSSLERHATDDADLQRVADAVGMITACVLFVLLGNPRDYSCGEAYRKAMGLNLKERSSGKHQGRLKITKRGPSGARRWLYLAALRMVKRPEVKSWYNKKKARDSDKGGKGVVAVMRKLALAVHAVAKGATFDAAKLFPGQNLSAAGSVKPAPALGALPPDPRNLPHSGPDRTGGTGRPA